MGITGLIPFLKPASRPVNIKEYAGCTVAIDSYCWLHRGAIACAEKLARGDTSDVYVHYCIRFVEMLLSHQVKPIMVFDGRHLPAKAETEKSRRERRENNKKRAADLLRQDRPDEARNVMKGCIDITPEMAFALIKRCRAMGVDCIVAPFEADAQLAYLNLSGIAHIVITEDSDLLLFGCERVLFKMDPVGNGLLVEQSKLPLAMKVHPDKFSMDKFRHMCILSGCDYLASLPGIGLGKACKFIKRTAETNISRALSKLGAHLNMSNLVVTPDYREKFLIADSMFKHQPVFDPISRKVVPLTPLPEGASAPDLEVLSPETSYQMSLGNLDPFTLKKFDNWDPDSDAARNYRTSGWNKGGHSSNSIWSKSFVKPKPILPLDRRKVDHATTQGKVVVHSVPKFEERINPSIPAKKKPAEEIEELKEIFRISSPPNKKSRTEEPPITPRRNPMVVVSSDPEDDPDVMNITSVEEDILKNLGFDDDDDVAQVDDLMPTSPVLVGNKFISHSRNKFSCSKRLSHSNSTESRGLAGMQKLQVTTEIDEENVVCSRFFSSDSNSENKPTSDSKGPKIGRLDDDEFNSELNRIIHIDGGSGVDSMGSTPKFTSPTRSSDDSVKDNSNVPIISPLSVVTELDKNLKFVEDRPSLLSRLDKMSQILSEKSPKKPVTTSSSNFNWQKKKTTPLQKSFTSYLAPGSTPSFSSSNSKRTKSVSKPSGLSKSKKPVSQGSLLESFGFKPKPKMTL